MTRSPEAGRRPLALILAIGLAVRLLYLVHVTSEPGFVWDDPDSYMRHGARLASGEDGWRFDFEAVEHHVEGGRYVLPPLYPVFLSLFAVFPGYPTNAQVAQSLLATASIFFVYLLGRWIHTARAGLIAAAIVALWLPNVIAVWSTMQEALYVPLVLLSLVLLSRANAFAGFAVSGLVLGLAALTRSIPIYFVPIAAALLLWRDGLRRGALHGAALVLGFLALTLPYSIALSRHLGTPTFIENHGGLRVAAEQGVKPGGRPPGAIETGLALARGFLAEPVETAIGWGDTARSILHVNGGRLLQIYLGAETRLGSILWKLASILSDVLFVAVLLLAPFGLLASRRRDLAGFLAAWILLNFGLTVLSGFGGPRLRAPFEPHLAVLAAVCVASGVRARRGWLVAAAVSLALALVVVPQLGRSFEAKADYGVHWPLDPLPKRSAMVGEAGFNVFAADGFIELAVRPRNEGAPTLVSVSLEGEPAEEVAIDEVEHWFRYEWPRRELVYLEMSSRDARSGEPVRMLVIVPAR